MGIDKFGWRFSLIFVKSRQNFITTNDLISHKSLPASYLEKNLNSVFESNYVIMVTYQVDIKDWISIRVFFTQDFWLLPLTCEFNIRLLKTWYRRIYCAKMTVI